MNIKIFDRIVSVQMIDPEEMEKEEAYGLAYNECGNNVVKLQSNLNDENLKRILIHELVHVCLDITGATEMFSEKEEDLIATSLEGIGIIVPDVIVKELRKECE